MENLVFTQLSIPEIRNLLRQELETFFRSNSPLVTQPEADQLISVKQASEFLGLSVPTIYGLVSKCQLPVNKRSKKLYFSQKELTAWIKEGRRKTISEIEAEAVNYKKGRER